MKKLRASADLQVSLERTLFAQPEREENCCPLVASCQRIKGPSRDGVPFAVFGTAALSPQVNECLFTVPRTQQPFPSLGALALAAVFPWNALLPDFRWQLLSHSLALGPNVTSSGKLSWTTLSETVPSPSPYPSLSHHLVLFCSIIYLLFENICKFCLLTLPHQNVGSWRVKSLSVLFATGPQCIICNRYSKILVEDINKCISARETEVSAELLVLKNHTLMWAGHTHPHLTDKHLRLREVYGRCPSTQQGGTSQSPVAFPGPPQSYTLEGAGLDSCATGRGRSSREV